MLENNNLSYTAQKHSSVNDIETFCLEMTDEHNYIETSLTVHKIIQV